MQKQRFLALSRPKVRTAGIKAQRPRNFVGATKMAKTNAESSTKLPHLTSKRDRFEDSYSVKF